MCKRKQLLVEQQELKKKTENAMCQPRAKHINPMPFNQQEIVLLNTSTDFGEWSTNTRKLHLAKKKAERKLPPKTKRQLIATSSRCDASKAADGNQQHQREG